jgi:transcriptional regulator with XRE-family HTH domain
MESDPIPFGQQLRHWRTAAGLSQFALGVHAGTSLRHIAFMETGNSRPGGELVRRLADALHLSERERSGLLVAARVPTTYPSSSSTRGSASQKLSVDR